MGLENKPNLSNRQKRRIEQHYLRCQAIELQAMYDNGNCFDGNDVGDLDDLDDLDAPSFYT